MARHIKRPGWYSRLGVYTSLIMFFLSTPAMFLQCSAAKEQLIPAKTLSEPEFLKLNWQEKVLFIKNELNTRADSSSSLVKLALKDKPAIRNAIMNKLASEENLEYKNMVLENIDSKDNTVRWRVLKYLEAFEPDANDVEFLAMRFNDNEWLVREAAFRILRRYQAEKEEKKVFFKVILSLNEKNSDVLREIYHTLRWYEDPRAFPYLYKRSYFASNTVELLYIMREMSHYKNDRVYRRLRQIERKHPKAMVRNTARQLLRGF